MIAYFAYGSNMSRPLMRRQCPGAREIGPASLAGYRFIITVDGFASIVPHSGGKVLGVLWRLSPRDLAALNAYESVDSGLYLRATLAVQADRQRVAALVYVARSSAAGRPKAGYMDLIVAAARERGLPERYVQSLARWQPTGWRGARMRESGEIA